MDGNDNEIKTAFGENILRFDLDKGTYSIHSGGVELFRGATGQLITRKKKGVEALSTRGRWEALGSGESGLSLAKREAWGRMLFKAVATGEALVVELGLLWESEGEEPSIEAVTPMVVPPGGVWPGRRSVKPWRFYVNGWQSRSASGALKSRRPGDHLFPLFLPRFLKATLANTATPVTSERGAFWSEWFGAFGDTDCGDSVVVGFTGLSRALSQISIRLGRKPEQSRLEAAARFEGKRAVRAEEFWGEPLAVVPGDMSGRNFETYMDMVAAEQGVATGRLTQARHRYSADVRKEDVLSDLEFLSGKYRGLGLDIVQVDDDCEREVAERIEAGDKLHGGVQYAARKIKVLGKTPGLCLAPFSVTRRSRIFRENKDWLTKGRWGRPVLAGFSPGRNGRFYGLDLTHPEVIEYIGEVFTALAGYGFRFFKLDSIGSGLLDGKRHDSSLTRAEAARSALRKIREAVGEESVIAAAGGPVLIGTGIVDVQSVGPDLGRAWRPLRQYLLRDRSAPGLRNFLISMFTRCFMNRRLFAADLDRLILREGDTELNTEERRSLASGIGVFGGSVVVSNGLGRWGPEQQSTAGRLLPLIPGRLRCPDLWRDEVPHYMLSQLKDPSGSYHLLWVVNWGAAERSFEVGLDELDIELGRYHAYEFWTENYLGEVGESLSLGRLPSHGSAVVRLTPAVDEPRLIGSNINVSQGAAELSSFEPELDGLGMVFTCPIRTGAVVLLSLPGAGSLHAGGGSFEREVDITRISTTVYRLEFDLDRRARVRLSWSTPPAA